MRRSATTAGAGRVLVIGIVLLLGAAAAGCASSSPSSSQLTIKGGSGSPYQDGQTVTVSFGANSKFTPNIRINILECSDPGGSASGLPTAYIDCDGNTIQGNTVNVAEDGSFSESGYTIYRLPSRALGESKSAVPVCDQAHPCVLMASQNQTDLTKPKVFSAPFTVSGTGLGTAS